MKPNSTKLHVASRGARGSRRADFSARLKARARALRSRLEHREALVESVRESNETLDPKFVADFLRVLEPSAQVVLNLIDGNSAAVFKGDENYSYVVMPLAREG